MVHSKEFGHALQHTITWRYLVLDEGHKIKNDQTKICAALRCVSRGGVVLLTGTPLQNNLHELYVLLAFMYPDVFTTAEPFDSAFDLGRNMVRSRSTCIITPNRMKKIIYF
jgi:SNF2 family DNA or RNA helicase